MSKRFILVLSLVVTCAAGCHRQQEVSRVAEPIPPHSLRHPLPSSAPPQLKQLVDGAIEQTRITTSYDPAYVSIKYPGGDVPPETGVCSDVIVRAFRNAGVDLQKEVHEDMKTAWSAYPRKWASNSPDTNIDHRRVLNLMTYLERLGKGLPATTDRKDYLPGDVVAWDLGGGMDHIGIVTNLSAEPEQNLLIVHNIGSGARAEYVLLAWPIKGHYRYFR